MNRTLRRRTGASVSLGLLAAAVVQLVDPNPNSQEGTTPPPPSASRIPKSHGLTLRIPIP